MWFWVGWWNDQHREFFQGIKCFSLRIFELKNVTVRNVRNLLSFHVVTWPHFSRHLLSNTQLWCRAWKLSVSFSGLPATGMYDMCCKRMRHLLICSPASHDTGGGGRKRHSVERGQHAESSKVSTSLKRFPSHWRWKKEDVESWRQIERKWMSKWPSE